MDWKTTGEAILLLLAGLALLAGGIYLVYGTLVRKNWGRRVWKVVKKAASDHLVVKVRRKRVRRAAAARTQPVAVATPQAATTNNSAGGNRKPRIGWAQIRRNARNWKMWLLLVGVEGMFMALWVPCNFFRLLVDHVAVPAINRSLISWWFGPPIWWFGLGLLFWMVLLCEWGNPLCLLLPSREYKEGRDRFPKTQILFFWLILLLAVVVFPYAIWLIASRFWGHAPLWLFGTVWLAYLAVPHWFRVIPAGEGYCVLFFGRPFQDHSEPGLTIIISPGALGRFFGPRVHEMLMVAAINIEEHDSPQVQTAQFRMQIGGARPQAPGHFSFKWQVVPPYGNFLRKVPAHELLAKASDGEQISEVVDLIGLAEKAMLDAADKAVADFTQVERLRLELDKAVKELAPAEEIERLRKLLADAEEEAVTDYLLRIHDIACKRGSLKNLGVRYTFIMDWDYPQGYGEAQDRAAAVGTRKRADREYAQEMQTTFSSQGAEGQQELFARFAGLLMSLVDKVVSGKRQS